MVHLFVFVPFALRVGFFVNALQILNAGVEKNEGTHAHSISAFIIQNTQDFGDNKALLFDHRLNLRI